MQRVGLACGDEVVIEATGDETIEVRISGGASYTIGREDSLALGEALTEEGSAPYHEERLPLWGCDVVLTGRFHGGRGVLRRQLGGRGACVRDFVHPGVILVTGELPARPTFKLRKARELGARIVSVEELQSSLN